MAETEIKANAQTPLEQARMRIDAIDCQMAALFAQRMDAVRMVAAYKQAHGLPVLDATREEAVVQKNLAHLGGTAEDTAAIAAFYEDFVRHNMALSRQFQTRLLGQSTVAYQGVEGAFSHIALKTLFPHGDALAFATWAQVFDAVEKGEAASGVLPFENSFAGDVSEVMDLCFAHPNLLVQQMYDLPVSQNLLGLPGARISDVRTVLSHPQALSQSARMLESLGLATQSCANTAEAARHVAQTGDLSLAAVASRETAALYGLQVLVRDIQTSGENTTRFIVIGKRCAQAGNRFSLLFTIENAAGQLARVIQTISAMGVNMECIKSRPMAHLPWEYYFYSELVGNCPDAVAEALRDVCKSVRVLGVYTRP